MSSTSVDPIEARRYSRVASLDQFRGYTVLGMLFVNFLAGFAALPAIFKHHNTYCSFADLIMPQFFFAVGYAYRLTFLKRVDKDSSKAAVGHALRRNFGLLLLGILYYHLDGRAQTWAEFTQLGLVGFIKNAFQKEPFQTLTHIALASLWMLPVIGRSLPVLMGYVLFSAMLHVAASWAYYFDWAMERRVIDGGPLGFLSWTIPLGLGALAYDLYRKWGARHVVLPLLAIGAGVMATGYGLSCLGKPSPAAPPFFPPAHAVDLWTMSQRAGTVSYLLFAGGFSMALFAFFVRFCDVGNWSLRVFALFGQNALVVYLLQGLIGNAWLEYGPRDAPLWFAFALWLGYLGVMCLFLRHLDRQGIHIKL